MKKILRFLSLGLACCLVQGLASAAGTLTPVGSSQLPLVIREHDARVVLNNGFARVEVAQVFRNPNSAPVEAIYAFPVPQGASLAEVTLASGEKILRGEVRAAAEVEQAYVEEKQAGRDAGLAKRNGYQNFEYRISAIPAGGEARLSFVYYQPLALDTGVGRFVYPLEEGATDVKAQSFWAQNNQVDGAFRFSIELKSAVPVADVRLPGFESAAKIERKDEGHFVASFEQAGAKLAKDVVFYYRLQEGVPGRVEVIPFRSGADRSGSFMMVVTPGQDLQPLTSGADFVYVLDVSGSMDAKLPKLIEGIRQALGAMKAGDRFRIVTFNDQAREIVPWTPATPENVQAALGAVAQLRSSGSTNLFDGMRLGLKRLDPERATSLVLVTDGVANEGVVDPRSFRELLSRTDIRVFGFLMGNSSNWPLLRTIAEASGGYYTPVSNDDDIVGQILMAKAKIGSEAFHDASLSFAGTAVRDITGNAARKIFYGQQLVVFGRYDQSGKARVILKARLTGEEKTYTTEFDLPETDTDNPEIERLWAMARIEEIEQKAAVGLLPQNQADAEIAELGVSYQLVTDHTSMVVLDDEAFARRGWDRLNLKRTQEEAAAQARKAQQPAVSRRVDAQQPAFDKPAPSVGRAASGGGSFEADAVGIVLFCLIAVGLAVTQADASRKATKRKEK